MLRNMSRGTVHMCEVIQHLEDKLQGFGKHEQALPCLRNEFGFAGHLGTNGCETGIRLVRVLMMMMVMMMMTI